MLDIPQPHRAHIALVTGALMPTIKATPDIILDLLPTPQTREKISESDLNRLAVAELVFLQEYLSARYVQGTKIDTPPWVIPFIRLTPKQLYGAMSDQKTGQKRFRELEKDMRISRSDRDLHEVFDIFKTVFAPQYRVSAVGKVGYYITKKLLLTPTVKQRREEFTDKAFWCAYAPHVAHKLSDKFSDQLTRGVHSAETTQVQKAYLFVTMKLLFAGYTKAEIARFLKVERKTIYNWLEPLGKK